MATEKEAQAKPDGKQASQVHFDDLFAKGWEEAVEPKEAPAPPPKKADEDECPDCPPAGTESKDKKPIEVLKHKGKEVPVYSKKQLIDLAQQGFDYTQKRQADSEDRKKWEADFETRNKSLMEQARRLDALIATAEGKMPQGAEKKESAEKAPKEPETDEQILQSYGVDPEYATDYERKLVVNQYKHDRELKEVKQVAQMMLLDAVFRRVTAAIEDAQKEYPIEDIKNEAGESVTQPQVVSIFRQKVTMPENQHRPIQEIARETIKEVHEFQKKGRPEEAPSAVDIESLSDDELAAKYPKLAARLRPAADQTDELPPTLDRTAKPPTRESVPRARVDSRHKFKSLAEAIEAGMNDPETVKAIRGG